MAGVPDLRALGARDPARAREAATVERGAAQYEDLDAAAAIMSPADYGLASQFRDAVRTFVAEGGTFLTGLEGDIRRAEGRGLLALAGDLKALRHRLGVAVADGKRLLSVNGRGDR